MPGICYAASSSQFGNGVSEILHCNHFKVTWFRSETVPRRNKDPLQAKSRSLFCSFRQLVHAPNFPCQTDLSHCNGSLWERNIAHGRSNSERNRKIRCRLDESHASDNIDKHILIACEETDPLFEDRNENTQTLAIYSRAHALGRWIRG
jgi:hypothetical protein